MTNTQGLNDTQLKELQEATSEAIRACNDAGGKLLHLAYLLKDIHFKPMQDNLDKLSNAMKAATVAGSTFTPAKKPIGDPLQELLHNTQKLSPSELAKITEHLSHCDTPVTDTKEST